MSAHAPDRREELTVLLEYVVLHSTTAGAQATSLRFTISDNEWIGAYGFVESMSPQKQAHFQVAYLDGPLLKDSYYDVGDGILPSPVLLPIPLAVNEFAHNHPNFAIARFQAKPRGDVLRLNLTVYTPIGPTVTLPLFLRPKSIGQSLYLTKSIFSGQLYLNSLYRAP